MLDWARAAGDMEMKALLRSSIEGFYAKDTGCPLNYEPSGEDFLSPCLGEADLMWRAAAHRYAAWLGVFLPQLPRDGSSAWLARHRHRPQRSQAGASRRPQLEPGLDAARHGARPAGSDARIAGLRGTAAAHRGAGLRAVTGAHYEGGHSLGTFAVYLVTAESPASR